MLSRLEAIWITQSGASGSSESSHCFATIKIWSTDSPVICDEEKRCAHSLIKAECMLVTDEHGDQTRML